MTAGPPLARWLPPALLDNGTDGGVFPVPPRLLAALLEAVDAQRQDLATEIDELWQNLFIESCADWAVPHLAALVGLPGDAGRLEVADAVALRRRKGTPGALEAFAEAVTGWTARVVEGWQATLWCPRIGHPGAVPKASVAIRAAGRSSRITPFDPARRSFSPAGRWAPQAATAVVWPWRIHTYRDTQVLPLDAAPPYRRFALHPLGAEAPLYLRPQPRRRSSAADDAQGRARSRSDAPVRVTWSLLEDLAGPAPADLVRGQDWQLGPNHPLAPRPGPGDPPLVALSVGGVAVPWADLRFAPLPEGRPPARAPTGGQVVVDVNRGQVEVGPNFAPATATAPAVVRATWHRPVAGRLGALASESDADPAARVVVIVNPRVPKAGLVVGTLAEAFELAESLSKASGLDAAGSRPGRPDVEIRLQTSDRLAAANLARTPTLPRWRVVASRLATPTIVGDWRLDLTGGELTLEGFALAGQLLLGKGLAVVSLRSLTMNPPAAVAVRIDDAAWNLALDAERCLLAPIFAPLGPPLRLTDCVVDGRRALLRSCGGPDKGVGAGAVAVAGNGGLAPDLVADGVTFAGSVVAESVDAVNCVFVDGVSVVQQQQGGLRHCYMAAPALGTTSWPPAYRCGPFPGPSFASVGFEAAGYYALRLEPDHPLLSAASDGGEVGAYHREGRAARVARLVRRIDEFVPLGLRAAVAVAPWEE